MITLKIMSEREFYESAVYKKMSLLEEFKNAILGNPPKIETLKKAAQVYRMLDLQASVSSIHWTKGDRRNWKEPFEIRKDFVGGTIDWEKGTFTPMRLSVPQKPKPGMSYYEMALNKG